MDPKKRSLFEAHYQIGLFLKETFIPKAYLYFMNLQADNKHRKVSKTSSNEQKIGNSTKVSPKKTPISKPAVSKTNSDPKQIKSPIGNGELANRSSALSQNFEEDRKSIDRKSAIVEVLPPPAADTIAGRYRLVKTENFDEFMKKLGVGLVKRKLANSVSPMNIIIVNEDGKVFLSFLLRERSSKV